MRLTKTQSSGTVSLILALFALAFLAQGQAFGVSETVIWSFGGSADGSKPYGGLITDASGNFYGTTYNGGLYGKGTIFKLQTDGTESVLWSFGSGTDDQNPYAGLIADAQGNLYGTTTAGGLDGKGTARPSC